MSFKDKPLKKIVADKRVTLDVIHSDVVSNFKKNKEEYEENIRKMDSLEKSTENSTENELKILEREIGKYDKDEEIEYYFDTGEILSEYYSQKNGDVQQEKKYISVIDIMSKKTRDEKPKKDIINEYMSKIDDNVIPEIYEENIDICPKCYNQLILKHTDCLLLCEKCGFTEKYLINSEKTSYKDPPRESSYFA